MAKVISIEDLSKVYQLGVVSRGMLYADLQSWWARVRKKPDPHAPILGEGVKGRLDAEGHLWALRNVTASIEEGETVGIIGRNGSGKSTLLKILSKVTAPTSGAVKIRGRMASLLEVGTGFHPDLTGRENVFLNGAILGMTRAEVRSKFDEIIDFAEIEEFIDTPVKRYSSGMYVRLAFAVAAHLNPEILVVDEVLAVGDIQFQNKCLGKIGEVSRGGRTVLFVSHNMAAIQHLCSRCLLMDGGSLVYDGPTQDAIAEYVRRLRTNSQVEVSKRTDRKGAQALQFINTWIENSVGDRTDKIQAGENMVFNAVVEVNDPAQLSQTRVSFAINGSLGQTLTVLDSALTDSLFPLKEKRRFHIRAEIPKPPFAIGHYTYNVFAAADDEVQDWVLDAGSFEILHGKFYSSGRLPERSHAMFLLTQDWNCEALTGRD